MIEDLMHNNSIVGLSSRSYGHIDKENKVVIEETIEVNIMDKTSGK